jgi:hypothetical protein
MDPRLRRRAALLARAVARVMRRRATWVAGAASATLLLSAFSFGPLVRSVARATATRRHLTLEIGSVRPAWFAVRLRDVVVRPESMPSIVVRLDEVRAGLTLGFGIERLDLDGVMVDVRGATTEIRSQFAAWHDLSTAASAPTVTSSPGPIVAVDGLSLRWRDGDSPRPAGELDAVAATWDRDGLRWRAGSARLRADSAEASLSEGEGQLDRRGGVVRARASAFVVDLAGVDDPGHGERIASNVPASVGSVAPADPGAPVIPLPDTHALREELAILSSLLSERLREGADVGVDALTWRIARAGEAVPFTLGPGPVTIARTDGGFEIKYSTDPRVASTPLAVRGWLPRAGDATISLEGGPVSLLLLGVQERGGGLVDVAHTTITGRARLVLAEDGSALTFDGEGGARDLSISNPRLALDVVRGLDLQFHARGATAADGELRLDDLAASVGAFHLAAGGTLDQKPDHVSGAFHFDVPRGNCESLLDSLPSALLPALQGMRIAGAFGARGRFAFDTRNLDALELTYDVQDECRVMEVPPELARARFEQAFSHGVYLPDGTIAEETTGPGTDNWTPLDEISPYMQVAVLTTEDGGFPKHHGFNRASIRLALIANLKARRFARGASTITMQLAKNLFLSRNKTLSRKLEEVILTEYLEQTFSKDELMELYLNVIEFGPAVYGITAAADHYFGRTPAELNLGECLFLSSLLPAPLRYGAMRDNGEVPEGWMHLLRNLMQIAHHYGRITDAELEAAKKEPVVFWHGGEKPAPRPPVRARTELEGDTDDVGTAPPLDAPSR